jgi:GNAT superfamily N-acetyltransferase
LAVLGPEKVDLLAIEPLKQIHKIDTFSCGNADLDEFLKQDALKQKEACYGTTHLLIHNNREIIGFFTLLNDSITINERDRARIKAEKDISYKDTPALKIGRFAIDTRFQRQGYGTTTLKWIFGEARRQNKTQGCRVVTVDSYPEKVTWYEKFGFVRALAEERRPDCDNVLLYVDIRLVSEKSESNERGAEPSPV